MKFKDNAFLLFLSLCTSLIFCNKKVTFNYVLQLSIIKQFGIFLHVFLVTVLAKYNYGVALFHVAHPHHFSMSSKPFLKRPSSTYFSLCLCKRPGRSGSAIEPSLH